LRGRPARTDSTAISSIAPAPTDKLQRLARRLNAASLAVGGLGHTPDVDAAAELVLDVACELEAFTAAGDARRVVARRRIGRGA
jgi:hypothetical protein